MWFAVLGAPAAWALQFGLMYWVTEADCRGPANRWGIDLDVWAVVATAAALAAAAGAGATAAWLFRNTRDAEDEDAPPAGRIHFLAVIGLAVTPLFVAIIVLNFVGVLAHGDCRMS